MERPVGPPAIFPPVSGYRHCSYDSEQACGLLAPMDGVPRERIGPASPPWQNACRTRSEAVLTPLTPPHAIGRDPPRR